MQIHKSAKMFLSGMTLATAMAAGSTGVSAADDEQNALLAANAGFYNAINKLFVGEIAPMEVVWSHADDVTYMGPTGDYDHGWPAILKNWQGQAALHLGGHIHPSDIQVTVGRNLGIVSDFEVGENTNAKGEVVRLKLRATNLYRKEGGQWKMIGHHTDVLPYLAK